jgi:hypothetical protein
MPRACGVGSLVIGGVDLPLGVQIDPGAKAITEPFPTHVAAALYPIPRRTGLQAAC